MMRGVFSVLLILLLAGLPRVEVHGQTDHLEVLKYDLTIRLDLSRRGVYIPLNSLSGTARITAANVGPDAVGNVSFVLHRLLEVGALRVGDEPVDFSQRLTTVADWGSYQARATAAELPQAVLPGETVTFEIDYSGGMDGNQASGMLYVQESLDPEFTIIRSETAIYPHLAEPSRESMRRDLSTGTGFDQVLRVTVPEGLTVASGHELVSSSTEGGWTTWHYRSVDPAFQIVAPVGPYEVIEAGTGRVYHFPEDSVGGRRVAEGISRASALYQEWFGPLRDPVRIAVIEIPEWHGSQALRPTVLQESTAFKNASAMIELYHEISHFWNVSDPSPTAARWNEGLATYLQYVTQEVLDGDTLDTDAAWDRRLDQFRRVLAEDVAHQGVPLAEAGEARLTSTLSYRGGGLMFALLSRRLGRDRLLSILGEFYQTHFESGATSRQFEHFLAERAPDARAILNDWFSGSTYSTLILQDLDFAALVDRYASG